MFNEPHNTARNRHIAVSCNPRNAGASEKAAQIARALFHLDGMAGVVDADIASNAGFIASCCRVIDRELTSETVPKTEPHAELSKRVYETLFHGTDTEKI